MASKTALQATETLDFWFGNTPPTPPTDWYFGLLDDSDTELTGFGYSRFEVESGDTNFDPTGDGERTVTVEISFAASGGDWAEAVKIGIWDAPTGGNLRYIDLLRDSDGDPSSVTLTDGTELALAVGNIIITEVIAS